MSFHNKIVLLGDAGVGKTCLISRFTLGLFNNELKSSVGVCCAPYLFETEEYSKEIQIWDTAGSEKYKSMAPFYARDAIGAIIVFDLTCKESYNNVEGWSQIVPPEVPIIVFGNKCDLKNKREINYEEAVKHFEENNYNYVETSASTGEGVEEGFITIIKTGLDSQKNASITVPSVDLTDKKQPEKKNCC